MKLEDVKMFLKICIMIGFINSCIQLFNTNLKNFYVCVIYTAVLILIHILIELYYHKKK